jgi:PTH1 family peptidyl-tRNA hydrolase
LWIVVGLGNPGKKYLASRHNVGFRLVQRFADKLNVKLKKRKYSARAAQVELVGHPVLLVQPWTFMNNSGQAVKKLLEFSGIKSNRMLVVYDDLDIPLGEIRVRKSGGAGTHNGMASIVQEIGSTDFPRIRVGIGPLPSGIQATDYVLTDFSNGEKQAIENSFAKCEASVRVILAEGIEKAMNEFNKRATGSNGEN